MKSKRRETENPDIPTIVWRAEPMSAAQRRDWDLLWAWLLRPAPDEAARGVDERRRQEHMTQK